MGGRSTAHAERTCDHWRLVAILAMVAAVSACQGDKPPAELTATGAIAAGSNLLGEPCRIERAGAGRVGAEAPFEIYCGSWEQPSARIVRVVTPGGAESLEDLAIHGDWRSRIDSLASCDPPQTASVLGDVPALRLNCAIRRGGWSYQALVARIGDTAFLGDTIPAATPVLERSIALLAGRATPEDAAGLAAQAPAQSGQGSHLYSVGDLDGYRQLLRRAQYYNFQGQYPEAEKLYRKALALQTDRAVVEGGLAYVLMSLGLELSNQERFAEAAAYFGQAEALLPVSLDAADEARLTSYRAIDLANQKRSQRARELARDASAVRTQLAGGFASPAVASVPQPQTSYYGNTAPPASDSSRLKIIGRGETARGDLVQSKYLEAAMLVRQEQFDDALAILAQARSVLDVDPRVPRHWLPQIQVLEALIAERRGDLSAAQGLLQDAIAAFRTLAAGSRTQALALLALGRAEARRGQTAAALDSFRSAVAMIGEARQGVQFDEVWPFFELVLAEAARDPSARQRLFAEMFAVGQLVQTTQTAQTIALASARLSSSDRQVGALIRELQDARQKRDAVNQALAAARTDPAVLGPQLEALEERWRTLNGTIADVERRVQAAAPRYNLILDTPAPTEAVLAALRPDEALYQVMLGRERALAFYVDTEGIEAFQVDLDEAKAATFVALLRAPFDSVVGAPYDVEKAYDLYRRLFQPVEARVASRPHLITVPGGGLATLPFGALITRAPSFSSSSDYAQLDWLAKRQAVSLAPSVQSFISLRTQVRPSQAMKGLIGFGDFTPDRDIERILKDRGLPETCRSAITALAGMSRLPGSAAELRSVSAAFAPAASSIILGPEFTEARVKREQLADYRIVYFATHALLPHDFNCWAEPVLLTSVTSRGDGREDGLLFASEIAELTLDADLVVLSACNTAGPGGGSGAESLSGLARAFFYAGARSLLVTHWPIPDRATDRLMTRTFRELATADLTIAEALRRAQQSLIADPSTAHPFNWAAFSVVGDGGQRIRSVPGASTADTSVSG
ncbi:MAG: CHAT domain-containing protein [Rhodospirillales bacterium]